MVSRKDTKQIRPSVEINIAILNSLVRAINQGDLKLIRKFGLSTKHLRKISEFDISGLSQIANFENLISFSIDSEMMELVISEIEVSKSDKDLIEKLVKADASHLYLYEQFGLTREKYIMLRSIYGMTSVTRGTPRVPEDKEMRAIFKSWSKHKKLNGRFKNIRPQVLQLIHDDTGISARVIVREVENNILGDSHG